MTDNHYITETKLAGVFIITRPTFADDRGFFRETFRLDSIEEKVDGPIAFKQANHSRSKQHTLRGIHIAPWHKLVTVAHGNVQQVVVDTRENSSTFGQHISIHLGEENFSSVFIPKGCGNSFLVLSDSADYIYMATDFWAPGKEQNVAYNDAQISIRWESNTPQVSEKDSQNPLLSELFK